MQKRSRIVSTLFLAPILLAFTGCAITSTSTNEIVSTGSTQGSAIQGSVHGGQQAVVGSHVYLFAAGTGGTGTAATSLLNAATTGHSDAVGAYVLTDVSGAFNITNAYSCTVNTQVYLYALGGNPGGGTNTAAGFLAVLGNCPTGGSFATQTPFVLMNEVSTVAAAYAFAGYATSATNVASSGSALALTGIANAFANAASLYNLAAPFPGIARTTTVAGNGVVPQATINTIANILAACVNTTAALNPCTTLLGNAKNGTVTPTETATAAINIAHNAGSNVATLYGLQTASTAFQPSIMTQPNDFSITITYTNANFSKPAGIAIDAAGAAWIANQGSTNVTRISPLGVQTTNLSYGHLINPFGIAVDTAGTIWMSTTNHAVGDAGNYLYSITAPTGTPVTGYYTLNATSSQTLVAIDGNGNPSSSGLATAEPYLYIKNGTSVYYVDIGGNNLNNPYAVAVDTNNQTWLTSYSPTSTTGVSLLDATFDTTAGLSGSLGTNTNYKAGSGVAIDHSNNAWVSDYVTGYLCEWDNNDNGLASYNTGGLSGSHPVGLSIDGASNVWTLTSAGQLIGLKNTGVAISGATGYTTGVTGTLLGPAVDGSGNVWFTNSTTNKVSEVIGAAVPVATPLAYGVANNKLGLVP